MSYGSYSVTPVSAQTSERPSLALDLSPAITQNLQSTKVSDKIIGVKTLLAVMSKGEDVSGFFPLVVQEITSDNETLRHLSYVYLVHYASVDSDSALMSVNTFQRSLTDSDPIVRALSLKVLSSIQNPEIIGIIMEAASACSLDLSPYVRKAAALALVKIFEIDQTLIDSILRILERLLNDQSVITISGALYALNCISFDNDSFIHPIFRTLCRILHKLDPWGATIALRILTRYSRRNFEKPSGSSDWFNDEEDEKPIDQDLDLLIKSVQPLLHSLTPSVTLAAASLLFYCAPPLKMQLIAKPLIRLVYSDYATSYAGLMAISSFVSMNPDPFVPHVRHFFITYDDPFHVKKLKLQVLSQLARPSNSDILIKELAQHINDPCKEVAAEAVKAIGRTASLAGESSMNCIDVIVKMLNSPSQIVMCQAAQVLCMLLRPYPKEVEQKDSEDVFGSSSLIDQNDVVSVLKALLRVYNKIEEPDTKAAMISLFGDKATLIPLQACEVLRISASKFTELPPQIKMQSLNLGAKVLCIKPKEMVDLVRYIFTLGFYDLDIDIRDKARLFHSLISAKSESEYILQLRKHINDIVFPKKPVVVWNGDVVKAEEIQAGSFSQLFGKILSRNSQVVDWVDPNDLPESTVRDEEAEDNEQKIVTISAKSFEEEEDFESFLGGSSTKQESKLKRKLELPKQEEEDMNEESKDESDLDNFFN